MSQYVDHTPVEEKAGVLIPWFDGQTQPSEERIQETSGLVEALGCSLGFIDDVRIRQKSPSHLISSGLLEQFKTKLEEHDCSIAIIDGQLSPIQQRNLERTLKIKVIDRTGLILEIFGLRARTREGVLQVELARLNYEKSRLVRTWTHLERQRGGRGFLGGPGETQLEADKRMIDRALKNLNADLESVKKTRRLQRTGRQRQGTPTVALVGYTNAGKSTLFNRITGAEVFAKDMPFATLDPTIRNVTLPNAGEIAIVDTVGFISDLPTHLIDSFKATLEEVMQADLLVHVRDRSSNSDASNRQDVMAILHQLEDASDGELPPIVEAWNKCDLLSEDKYKYLSDVATNSEDGDVVLVSALTGEGIDELLSTIEAKLVRDRKIYTISISPSDGRARAWLHQNAVVQNESSTDTQITMSVDMDSATYEQWLQLFEDQSSDTR